MDRRKSIFVVLNPVAGLANPARAIRRIQEWCDLHGWVCAIYETSGGEDLSQPISTAISAGFQVVAAAGGDGTVSCVAAGMVFSPVPMIILPLGTGNLLARDLGIPMDLVRALNVLEEENTTLRLDVMEVNHHYCVLNAGVGLSSLIIKNTNLEEKRRFGMLAYFKSALYTLLGLQPHSFQLAMDGARLKIRASEIYIANGGLLGLQVPFKDVHVLPDDGRVDIFVIKARSLLDYLELLYYLIRRRPRQAPKMFYTQAGDTIQIESERTLPVQSDGEVIGETPVSIRVIPNAVRVLLPPRTNEDLVTKILQMVGL